MENRILRVDRALLVVGACALLQPGCSALIDSSRYVGNGSVDGGVGDADRPDGEVPIDGDLPNRPPVLTTVALSSYMPQLGSALRATPGPVVDPDGDTTLVRYQWFRGDVAIEGANGAQLATDGLTAGDAIRVEAWAYDGTLEGAHVGAGPVVLAADVTRWRPIAPDELTNFGFVFYDEPNRRYVRVGADLVWEYWVDAAGALHVAPIEIAGNGPAADDGFLALHDAAGRRVIAVTGTGSDAFALDLSRRGAESWSSLPLAGIPPTLRFGAATWYDPTTRRAWLYGGFRDGGVDGLSNELWTLDLTPGSERWEQHTVSGIGSPPALFGATMTSDPTVEGALILAGGATLSGGDVSLPLTMYRLTIGDGTVTMEELSSLLPTGAFGTSSATDPVGDRIVLVGGSADIDTPSMVFGAAVFDPATGAIVRPPSPMVAEGGFGLAHVDPDDTSRVLAFRGFGPSGEAGIGFDLRAVDAASGAVTPIVQEQRPPGLSEAGASSRGDAAVFLGGRRDDGSANGIVYSLDLRTAAWSTITVAGDAISGNSPTPRYGNMFFDASPWRGLQLWSGRVDSSSFADGEVWELRDGRWLHRTLRVGVPPTARIGAAMIATGACGADQNYVFGGQSSSGALLDDTQTLVCDLGDRTRDCIWEPSAAGGAAPSPRSWATMGIDGASTAWVFGGWTGAGSSASLHTFNVCAGGAALWEAATATGTAPSARHGHSMVYDSPESGGLSSFLVFGGTEDGSTESTRNDVFRLEITSATTARWVPIEPTGTLRPPPRAFHQVVWDDGGSRMIVFGGRDPYSTHGDVWELLVRP